MLKRHGKKKYIYIVTKCFFNLVQNSIHSKSMKNKFATKFDYIRTPIQLKMQGIMRWNTIFALIQRFVAL